MDLITRQSRAAEAAQRWKNSYYLSDGRWSELRSGNSKVVYANLVSLGNNPSPDSVDSAIGNASWTRVHCDECNQDVDAVVQLGEAPDFESHTACVCPQCLAKAINLVSKVSDGEL